jgi:hypothetical protein
VGLLHGLPPIAGEEQLVGLPVQQHAVHHQDGVGVVDEEDLLGAHGRYSL